MQRLLLLLCAAAAAAAGMLLLLLPTVLLLISGGVRFPLSWRAGPLLLGQPVGQVPAVRLL
jgi:hypothetical protein